MHLYYIVNVLVSTQPTIQEVMPGGGLTHLQFGPCSKQEGEELADRINAWGRGGEGKGSKGLSQILGLSQPCVDVWASCDEVRLSTSRAVGQLMEKFRKETASMSCGDFG